MPATLCAWVDGHFAATTVEAEREKLAGAETQITRLLVGGIRIRLAAMSQLKEQAVAASHQVIYHFFIHFVHTIYFVVWVIWSFVVGRLRLLCAIGSAC